MEKDIFDKAKDFSMDMVHFLDDSNKDDLSLIIFLDSLLTSTLQATKAKLLKHIKADPKRVNKWIDDDNLTIAGKMEVFTERINLQLAVLDLYKANIKENNNECDNCGLCNN